MNMNLNMKNFFQQNAVENVSTNITILFRPQYVISAQLHGKCILLQIYKYLVSVEDSVFQKFVSCLAGGSFQLCFFPS